MNVKWIVEDFNEDTGFDSLAKEIMNQGMDCQIINTKDNIKVDLGRYSKDDCIMVQSSFEFADGISKVKDFLPFRFFTPKNYKCTSYYKYYGDFLFNSDYVLMTRSEVKRNIDFLVRILGEKETGRIFIRPDSGMKSFTGMVFINRKDLFEYDWNMVEYNTFDNDILVISSPKKIANEYRFVVVNGVVITGSLYRSDYDTVFQTINEDDFELFNFAQKMANLYQPDLTYTLDIVRTENNDYKLIEINSFSHAGLYKCDMAKIVKEVSKLAKRYVQSN